MRVPGEANGQALGVMAEAQMITTGIGMTPKALILMMITTGGETDTSISITVEGFRL